MLWNLNWRTYCIFGFTILSLNLIHKCECLEVTADIPDDQIYTNQPSNPYSALVVFGDSYSDNGHPRSAAFQKSLSPLPSFGGRYCDGRVWDEYLAQNLSAETNITYLNYAYNGAHINNSISNLTYALPPDTATQIQTYLNELQQYVAQPISTQAYEARILHTMWIGINPLISMWRTRLNDAKSNDTQTLLGPELSQQLDSQVGELINQLNQLLYDRNLSKFTTDYVLMTIPPLTNTQLIRDAASVAAGKNSTVTQKYLKLLVDMTDYFNSKLVEKVKKTKADFPNSSQRTQISVFDTVELWKEVEAKPWMFGISSLGACVTDRRRCANPDRFMYWDVLHPSSNLHAHLANAMLNFLQGVDE